MDRATLRKAQAPLRHLYEDDPAAARVPLRATGDFRDSGITATVDGWAGPVRAGLHRATGGTGDDACSGDLLLEALAACAGVTLRSVATAYGLELGAVAIRADAVFDARGTLGVDRDVAVGIDEVRVTAHAGADLDDSTCERLAQAVERYCVVGQSLRCPVSFWVRGHEPA